MTQLTEDQRKQLAPCPFCGCAMSSDGGHDEGCYFTALAALKNAPPADLSLAPSVLEAWNRRATAAQAEVQTPAHSKSEYKRRVAQGDPSVLPPVEVQKPVAWMLEGGRTFVDDVFKSKASAEQSADRRKDGATLAPLFSGPTLPLVQQWMEAMEIGRAHAQWSTDRSKDVTERRINEHDVKRIDAAINSMREWIEEQKA